MANYSFVIDSSFKPFSFQEMLAPWVMYGNAYEKTEEAYNDLSKKAGDFEYLSKTLPEGSRAREIYEGYANDLKIQAEDLVRNGLNMRNRAALTGLKGRYSSEIGRLEKADAALRAERELRRNMLAKDSSMMFGNENLSIDNFLDNEQPNLYSISGNELYARGAQAGKSASSRMYEAGDEGSTLGGYYKKWTERMGVSQDSIEGFMNSDAVQQQVDNILAERGVTDNFGIDSDNYRKARQSVLNGIYDGIVYQESVKPMRDVSVMTPAEKQAYDIAGAQWNMQKRDWEDRRNLMYEYETDAEGNVKRDANGYPIVKGYKNELPEGYTRDANGRIVSVGGKSSSGKSGSSSSGNGSGGSGKTAHFTQGDKPIRIQWKGNDPAEGGDVAKDYEVSTISSDAEEEGYVGNMYDYDELPSEVQKIVDKRIGRGNAEYYEYYYKPFERGAWNGFWNDTEAALDIVPKKIVTDDSVADALAGLFGLQ